MKRGITFMEPLMLSDLEDTSLGEQFSFIIQTHNIKVENSFQYEYTVINFNLVKFEYDISLIDTDYIPVFDCTATHKLITVHLWSYVVSDLTSY